MTLPSEVERKFERGYPRDNILFQDPHRAILWQNNQQRLDADLTDSDRTDRDARNLLFSPSAGIYGMGGGSIGIQGQGARAWCRGWRNASMVNGRRTKRLSPPLLTSMTKCRQSINPNLSEAAVEEMLIQHLLTERIFRTVFDNQDFTRRNVIANEIEQSDRRAHKPVVQPSRFSPSA